jgi:hypothetical protein
MRPSNFFGGLIIIAVGVLFLGVNAGWWSSEIWGQLWRLWPVAIIIVGLRQAIKSDPLFLLLSLVAIGIGLVLSYQNLLGSAAISLNGGPIAHVEELNKEFSKSFNWSTSPEDRKMPQETNQFKSEIQVNGVDTLAIQLARNYDITVTGTQGESVVVDLKGEQKILDDLSFAPDGNRLVLKENANDNLTIFTDKEKVTGTISVPRALALDLKLGGVVKMKGTMLGSKFKLMGSGSSVINFDQSTAQDPEITLSGTSRVALDQCTGTATVDLSGVSTLAANTCALSSLTVKADGTSSLDIKAGSITDLKATASGVAKIKMPRPSGTSDAKNDGVSSISYY